LTILYLADIRFPLERANGIQTMETCWALASRGHRVRLIVRPDTHAPRRDPFAYYGVAPLPALTIEQAPIPAIGLPGLPAIATRVGYLSFAAGRVMGAAGADLLMTRDLGLASLLLRLPGRAPLVYESHGYAPAVAAALPSMLSTATTPSAAKISRLGRRESRVWHGAEGYVTITAGLADELRRRFGARDRVAVIPDGVRLDPDDEVRLKPGTIASGDVHRRPVVAYAGHLYAWKGVDLLLRALAQVPEVDASIVGGHEREPDLARMRSLASTLGLEARVTFTGQVRPPEVPARLAAADILVLPNPASAISTHATSPLKLFEYMAAGRAIVASDLPSIREVLTDERTALLVPPGDPAAMAVAIRRLASDAALGARLGAAARAEVAQYSWSRRAERLETLFRQVLDARTAMSDRR
jgi:glycosyltransferase involved in cell wall biosynthesis